MRDDVRRIDEVSGVQHSPAEAPVEFVWHPAIRALGWVKDWIFFTVLLAVAWQSLASGELSRTSVGPVAARACAAAVALGLLFAVVLVGEFWWFHVRVARRMYAVWGEYIPRVSILICEVQAGEQIAIPVGVDDASAQYGAVVEDLTVGRREVTEEELLC